MTKSDEYPVLLEKLESILRNAKQPVVLIMFTRLRNPVSRTTVDGRNPWHPALELLI